MYVSKCKFLSLGEYSVPRAALIGMRCPMRVMTKSLINHEVRARTTEISC